MSFGSLLNKNASIQRQVAGVDGFGAPDGAWAENSTAPVRLTTTKGTEERDGQIVAVTKTKAFMAAGVDVTEADRLIIDGVTYEISAVVEPGGGGHHLELDLKDFA